METNDQNFSSNPVEENDKLTGNDSVPGDNENDNDDAVEEDGTPVLEEEDLEENDLDEDEVEDIEWEEPDSK
jgi:hypothetical protein